MISKSENFKKYVSHACIFLIDIRVSTCVCMCMCMCVCVYVFPGRGYTANVLRPSILV